MPGESKCKRCGALIVWGVTTTGRNIPLDTVPALNGNIEVDDKYRTTIVDPDPEVRRYVSHFATCPAAGEFRGRGRK